MMQRKLLFIWLVVVLVVAGIIQVDGDNIKSAAQVQSQSLLVSCTCYTYNSPNNITATGKYVSTKYIAVSRDVEKLFPLHSKIVLTCGVNKIYATVEDRMSKRWKKRVDIFLTTKKACKKWGVKRNCKLEKMK